jgi:hypothetical protein
MAHRLDRLTLPLAAFLAALSLSSPAAAMPFLAAVPFATALATAVVGAVVSFGLSFVAKALMAPQTKKAAPIDASTNSSDSKVTLKQAVAPRRIIYGKTRVSGIFAFLAVSNGNQLLSGIIMWAGHQVQAIDEIWMNDEAVTLDPVTDQVTSGKFAGNANVTRDRLGTSDQLVERICNFNHPDKWTAAHRLRGIALSGFQLYWDNTTGTGNPNIGTFQVLHLGAKLWTNGIPNITAVIRGKLVYDPRTETTAYSDNPALIVADYLCDPVYGYGASYETGINIEALIAAANACDEEVPLKEGGTEKRYTCNGTFESDQPRDQLLGRLLASMQGRAVYDGDQWIIFAGVWMPATETITDDEMRAPSTIATMQSAMDSFNGVKGVFNSPENKYVAADFPAVVSDALRVLDGGEESLNDIELPFTDSAPMAQRIAKIQLLDARQEIREVFRGKLSAWRVLGGTTIKRKSPRYGWDEKLFFVEKVELVFEQDETGNPIVGCDLHLKETAEEIFDWTTDEESLVEPAPNSNFPDIFNVLPVSNVRAEEFQYVALAGAGVQVGVRVMWGESPDAMVRTGGYYRVRYRLADAVLWTKAPDTTFISTEIRNIPPGLYYFEVSSVNWAGNESPITRIQFQVVGLSAKPAAPTGFSVAAMDSIGYARWTLVDDFDVAEGGFYVLRHSPATDGSATWETAVSMGDDVPGKTNVIAVPLVPGTYLLKSRDSTGNYSESWAAFTQFQTSVHQFALVSGGSSVQDPDFAGAKTNCVVVNDVLRLDADGVFDDVPEVDDLAAWDFALGVLTSGTYEYDAIMELTSRTRVRLTNVCDMAVYNVFDNFDERELESDAWDQWDGTATGNEGETWLDVEWTPDDPGPGRTWYGPQRLHAASFDMKAARFTRQLRSNDSSYTVAIAADAVYAEEVVI